MHRRIHLFCLAMLLTMGCAQKTPTTAAKQAPASDAPGNAPTPPPGKQARLSDRSIAERNQALGPGVNLGNALEAPTEGAWGVTLRDEDFTLVAEAGFEHVRIPVRWSAHAADVAPYTIDPTFATRVKWAIDSALAAGLSAIVNVHHYEEMVKEPDAHKARLTAIWQQIAEAYADYPDSLYFELFNEPNDKLDAAKNNVLISELVAAIRPSNPDRALVVGSVQWNSFRGLPVLELPDDPNLIVTIHYYDPFDFTHQGAPWVNKQDEIGIDWPGEVGTRDGIAADLEVAVAWAKEQNRPLYLGEFGAFNKADMAARVRWTRAVVEEARKRNLPYAYWELRSGFGLYDLDKGAWRQQLLDAVLP